MSGVQSITVTADEAGIRLDRWFRRHFADLGHGRLEKLLRTGQVRVDGGRVKSSTRLEAGQVLRVPPLGPAKPRPVKQAPAMLDPSKLKELEAMVIHRDDDVLALNKPPGLAVQGGSGLKQHLDAMLDGLRFGLSERPRLVHRLDKDTSGVLVLARNAFAATKLAEAFRGRDAQKSYWALVVGAPRPKTGKITSELAKQGGKGNQKMTETTEGGLRAITEYSVVDEAGDRVAWLVLRPQTGRTHQLRVHCASLGTPILGDGKYGGREAFVDGLTGPQSLHLHARGLKIPHPRSGTLTLEAPLPKSMLATWKFLGFDVNSAPKS
ncbi:MAG: RluA family pseudouridine synthase [Rhodospirillaceae bacterium]|jgi:23S rRNA pseudouridine955/2504/2580 synthase|nr:RluA family pseudouridine synthase [Rhodospirillaceae bacterium]